MPKLNIPNINLIWIVYSSKKKKIQFLCLKLHVHVIYLKAPPPPQKKGGIVLPFSNSNFNGLCLNEFDLDSTVGWSEKVFFPPSTKKG